MTTGEADTRKKEKDRWLDVLCGRNERSNLTYELPYVSAVIT